MTASIPFTKLVGTGNDFVLVDTLRHRLDALRPRWSDLALALCDGRRGAGVDGLLLLERSRQADVRMRIFNPDGSEPSMCGNGVRCLAWYAHRSHAATSPMTIETKAGIRRAEVLGSQRVRIDMGTPRVLTRSTVGDRHPVLRFDHIDTGVPHLVCWVTKVDRVDVNRLGRRLRHDRRFQPAGTNVDFIQETAPRRLIVDRTIGKMLRHIQLDMRTYERGVEGETLACGTGAVAAATSAALFSSRGTNDQPADPLHIGRESDLDRYVVDVHVPGGRLQVQLGAKQHFDQRRLVFSHAFLDGTVRQLGRGTFPWNGRSHT